MFIKNWEGPSHLHRCQMQNTFMPVTWDSMSKDESGVSMPNTGLKKKRERERIICPSKKKIQRCNYATKFWKTI